MNVYKSFQYRTQFKDLRCLKYISCTCVPSHLDFVRQCPYKLSFTQFSVLVPMLSYPPSQVLLSLKMRLEEDQQIWQCILVCYHAKDFEFHVLSRVQHTLGHIIPKYAYFEQNVLFNICLFLKLSKLLLSLLLSPFCFTLFGIFC